MSNQINYEIEFYKKVGDERSPVDDYLDTMPEKHRQKAMAIMARLDAYSDEIGHRSNPNRPPVHCKSARSERSDARVV